MKVKAIFKIGKDSFEIEPSATDFKEQFLELTNARPRSKCDVCGNTDPEKFRLFVNKSKDSKGKEWTYVKILCDGNGGECKAQSVLGTFQDDKGHFWKKFERWEGESKKL